LIITSSGVSRGWPNGQLLTIPKFITHHFFWHDGNCPSIFFRWGQLSNPRRFHYPCTFEDSRCTIWMRCLLTRFNHLIISNDSEKSIDCLFHRANGLNDDDSTVFFRQNTRYYALMKNLDEHLKDLSKHMKPHWTETAERSKLKLFSMLIVTWFSQCKNYNINNLNRKLNKNQLSS
jgi:hypothetical protein